MDDENLASDTSLRSTEAFMTRCYLRVRGKGGVCVQSGNRDPHSQSHLQFGRRHCFRIIRSPDLGDSPLVKTRRRRTRRVDSQTGGTLGWSRTWSGAAQLGPLPFGNKNKRRPFRDYHYCYAAGRDRGRQWPLNRSRL